MITAIREQVRRTFKCGKRIARPILVVLIGCLVAGFGKHPADLTSSRDIRRTPSDTERIRLGLLPISDFPLLSKFKRVKDVDFFTMDGKGADDEKLKALSTLNFANLQEVGLLNCPAVTDEGIRYLSRISSLEGIGLEGTSITDESLEIMASKMRLTGVNVSNCPKVTMKGLLKLAPSETLKEFGFSVNDLSQEDVLRLINQFKKVTWCGIVDPAGKLDVQALKNLGKSKGVRIVVKRTGALQDVMKGGGRR